MLARLKSAGINCIFHYVPLHSSPAGRRYARMSGELKVTDDQAGRIVRLPLWIGLSGDQQARVADGLEEVLS